MIKELGLKHPVGDILGWSVNDVDSFDKIMPCDSIAWTDAGGIEGYEIKDGYWNDLIIFVPLHNVAWVANEV